MDATKRLTIIDQINQEYGKLPPAAIEVEEAVLGAYMLERDAILENPIKPEWFYKNENQIIANTIVELNRNGKKIDLLTVTMELKNHSKLEEVGGPAYITQLTRKVSSAAHLAQWLRIIQDKFIRRELIRMSHEVTNMSYDETNDFEDIFSKIQTHTLSVMDFEQNSVITLNDALVLVQNNINLNRQGGKIIGIPTGLKKIDEFTGGLQNSDLIIIAAETSQGKTSLALGISLNAGLSGFAGAIYSLEMSNVQVGARLLSSYSKVSSKRILFYPLSSFEIHDVEHGISQLANVPLYFDDNVNSTLDSIATSIRRMKLKYNIKFAVVDYIQNIKKLKGESDEASIGLICKTLKNLAKELDMPIVALSQLSRDRANPFPTLGRLRGSGQIEESADNVIFIYRAEYYNLNFPEPFENEDTQGKAMLIVAKGRNVGTVCTLNTFDKSTTTFGDIEDQYINQQESF